MRIALTVIFLSTFFSILYGQNNSSILKWKYDDVLQWEDFPGFNNINDTILISSLFKPDAVSFIGISRKYFRTNASLDVIIETYFNKHLSFYRDTTQFGLLEHEQCHFNIVELYARKMRKAVKQLKSRNINNKEQFDYVLDSLEVMMNSRQEEFDNATLFGSLIEEQNKWRLKIDNELRELEEYQY